MADVLEAAPGFVIGTAPDKETERDYWAVREAIMKLRFRYVEQIADEDGYLHFIRFEGPWVDMMHLHPDRPSYCRRYERRHFPWRRGKAPTVLDEVQPGTIVECVQQVRSWRRS